MELTTTICVIAEREDGTSTTLERTTVAHVGSNPSFERIEMVGALDVATHEFKEANALNGTRPL